MKAPLTTDDLLAEAGRFAAAQTLRDEPSLYGITDGKAVGTHIERRFSEQLGRVYDYNRGSAASGLDFPELRVDMKTTSARQPQSSCPFRNARQKIYGLGYGLLIFVYAKTDDPGARVARLRIEDALFVAEERTADYQMTRGILEILARDGIADDLLGFFSDRNLPLDEIGARALAEEVLLRPPEQGCLTISNALQWRLQFGRVIQGADELPGVRRIPRP